MDTIFSIGIGIVLGFSFRGFIAREGAALVAEVKAEVAKLVAEIKAKA